MEIASSLEKAFSGYLFSCNKHLLVISLFMQNQIVGGVGPREWLSSRQENVEEFARINPDRKYFIFTKP
jgi:hypothetical protein